MTSPPGGNTDGRRLRVLLVVGTRPEAIKMAPVIHAFRREPWCQVKVITSGQHGEVLDHALLELGVRPDIRLRYSARSKSLSQFVATAISALDREITSWKPNIVLAQGDTTTAHAAAMAAFYQGVAFVHVEAGLRSHDMASPFPEEYHRRAIGLVTDLHCAPTCGAYENLLQERIAPDDIVISGNTVIDSLLATVSEGVKPPADFPKGLRVMLVTLHRRESFGARIREALQSLRDVIDDRPDMAIYFPLHPNPSSRLAVEAVLGGHPRIRLVEPLAYRSLVAVLSACWCVVSDSGGLQEEAPALGKPVVVLRDTTERPEAVAAGVAVLVGTNPVAIRKALDRLYDDPTHFARMSEGAMPYGDGKAAARIVAKVCERWEHCLPAVSRQVTT
jgi:UDP-N-acetylglucosamine 2-epimerase (non-hydrolysing)